MNQQNIVIRVAMKALFITPLVVIFAVNGISTVSANTITVSNTNNSGSGSLRAAVASATDGDTIDFSVTGIITLSTEITLSKTLTIIGPGADQLSISGGSSSQIFYVSASGKTVIIKKLTLTNGRGGAHSVNISGFDFTGGGAIFHAAGTLQVVSCEITNNSSSAGNGSTSFDYGGGIAAFSNLTISNCLFTGNSISGSAGIKGGALNTFQSLTLNITNTTFYSNTSPNEAGAIAIDGFNSTSPNATIINCTFYDNSSGTNTSWGQDIDLQNGNMATLVLQNNIFNRSGASSYVSVRFLGSGTQTSNGGNIFRDTPTFSTVGSDDVNNGIGSAGLSGTLTDNGGDVRTISISGSGSLANNFGISSGAPSDDARGYIRVGNPDAGAYEFGGLASCAMTASASVSSPLNCNGDTDGQVTASASGGTASYTYSWNTGGTSATEIGLGAGTYSVTITDANGCTDSASITVNGVANLAGGNVNVSP